MPSFLVAEASQVEIPDQYATHEASTASFCLQFSTGELSSARHEGLFSTIQPQIVDQPRLIQTDFGSWILHEKGMVEY